MFFLPIEPVLGFILVFLRVLFFFSFMPLFSDPFTPVRIRVVLAMAVAFVFAPMANIAYEAFPQTIPQFLVILVPEAVLGFALGLLGRLVFGAVQIAGNLMGEQIGFGMANIVDPTHGTQMPVVAEILYITAILLFFAVNAHHFFFQALAESYRLVPPGSLGFSQGLNAFFTRKAAEMFFVAVQMSLPITIVIFVTNTAMGMVAKAVPQINVFLESFPIRIIVGLFMMSAILGFLARIIMNRFQILERDIFQLLLAFS